MDIVKKSFLFVIFFISSLTLAKITILSAEKVPVLGKEPIESAKTKDHIEMFDASFQKPNMTEETASKKEKDLLEQDTLRIEREESEKKFSITLAKPTVDSKSLASDIVEAGADIDNEGASKDIVIF